MQNSLRRSVCKFLIGVILFIQMAVAGYACPVASNVAPVAVSSADVISVDCDHMASMLDPAAPSLCHAHCHNHEQSADHADSPALPPGTFAALYWLFTQPRAEANVVTPNAVVLHAALPPPHAILHCCFRI